MRASRLITILLILKRRGRVTAAQLAAELEVSERTVLRDIDALAGAGIAVYATRGHGGGFELLDDRAPDLPMPSSSRPHSRVRATVRITPEGVQRAALLGRLQPLRVRPAMSAWHDASFPVSTLDEAIADVLSLGPHVRVLGPKELLAAVAEFAGRTAALYR